MLLALDTASPTVSVALLDVETAAVVQQDSEEPLQHGEQLVPVIEQVLARAGAERSDVTALVVGAGPGPFTGLRVGLVTARTLGLVLDVPVYAVCSLDAIALEAVERHGLDQPFVVATDARRREVYWADYDAEGTRLGPPAVERPASLAAALAGRPVVGEGAVLFPDDLPGGRPPLRPSAAFLAAAVAAERVELLDPDPLYLRRPDAVEPGTPKPVS